MSAGTLIENTAVASYDDGAGPRTINSNTVTVRVDELLDVTLTSLDPGPVPTRPGEAVLRFNLSQSDLGAFAGLARENVSRLLSDWEAQGIIAREGRELVLLDPDYVTELAEFGEEG